MIKVIERTGVQDTATATAMAMAMVTKTNYFIVETR